MCLGSYGQTSSLKRRPPSGGEALLQYLEKRRVFQCGGDAFLVVELFVD